MCGIETEIMCFLRRFASPVRWTFLVISFALGAPGQDSAALFSEPFQDGCCVNHSFARPEDVSQSTVSAVRLHEALNCAMNNKFIGGARYLANALGDQESFRVAYHYGVYMPEQEDPALTIAVYSVDGQHGVLFDVVWESRKYGVGNLPLLLRASKRWRVGEIDSGLWSYTRLWYLAQEIGSRPRFSIPVAVIQRAEPKSCSVLFEDQTNWKPGTRKSVGDSDNKAMVRQDVPRTPAVDVSAPNRILNLKADDVCAIDFPNARMVGENSEWNAQLRNGKYEREADFDNESVRLDHIYCFEGGGRERHALVVTDWTECGGSCMSTGVVQLFSVRADRPLITQQFDFDSHAKGTGVTFDPPSLTLTVTARSDDGSPNCCAQNFDVVTYRWLGDKFVQQNYTRVPVGAPQR